MKKSLILISIFLLLIGYLLWHHESKKNCLVNNTSQREYHESDLKIKEEDLEVNENEIFTENSENPDAIANSSNHTVQNTNQNSMESNNASNSNVVEKPKSNNKTEQEEKPSLDKEETVESNKNKEGEVPYNNEFDKNSWDAQKKEMEKEGYYNDAFSEEELNKKINTLLSYGYSPSYAPQCTKYNTLGEMCGYHIDAFIISSRVNKCIAPEDVSKIKYDDRGYVENTNWRNSQYNSIYKYLTSLGYDCTNVNDPYPL